MVNAMKAKGIQTEYLQSQCKVDTYLEDIEGEILCAARKGGSNCYFDFKKYGLDNHILAFAKAQVKDKLRSFGYTSLDGEQFSEIYIYW